jgi:hypothetical protein
LEGKEMTLCIVASITFLLGFLACAMLTAGKIEDLEKEILELEEIETDLNNTIGFMERGITEWKEKCDKMTLDIKA